MRVLSKNAGFTFLEVAVDALMILKEVHKPPIKLNAPRTDERSFLIEYLSKLMLLSCSTNCFIFPLIFKFYFIFIVNGWIVVTHD